ncbi:MAG: (2Fe-2S)-binding protein [Rhodanobacteraceae bacterium]|nr:(2Fe-2S)-binding protein [Rhodanobacteraceae bacterium]MBP9153608.1 (2Fe-2S)-binding protein [Xanthomonadales bacterium]HQW82805.1 (2Fe-2S)-binding protein [Pseudomonadota bacterium]
MFVCVCSAVTDRQIERAIASGADHLDAITAETGAGACCGSCRPLLLEIIEQHAGALPLAA